MWSEAIVKAAKELLAANPGKMTFSTALRKALESSPELRSQLAEYIAGIEAGQTATDGDTDATYGIVAKAARELVQKSAGALTPTQARAALWSVPQIYAAHQRDQAALDELPPAEQRLALAKRAARAKAESDLDQLGDDPVSQAIRRELAPVAKHIGELHAELEGMRDEQARQPRTAAEREVARLAEDFVSKAAANGRTVGMAKARMQVRELRPDLVRQHEAEVRALDERASNE